MLCDICKQNVAKVHLTQIIEGKTKKVDLCEACSKAKGIDDPTGFSLADLLLGLGAAQELEQASPRGGSRCPACGFTQADFKKHGRLGCPQCYETFATGLEAVLKTMHKGTRHVGKMPQNMQRSKDLEDRVRMLQRKLDRAVAEENFESAAVLRDELKQARDQISTREKPVAP
jgi:protein arginine kinase activator